MRRNLAMGAAVTALFFLLLEGILRLSGLVPTQALRSPDGETLASIPGLFEPGQDFVDRIRPELPYRIRINSQGFRGRELAARKQPGTTRILCLGDSYTFGHHVEDGEAFPARLQESLRSSGISAEVINAGANGFTIVDELDFLRGKGLALQPDVVVLVFSQNDLRDLLRPQPMIEAMRDHAALKSKPVLGPLLMVLQRTALFNGMQRGAAWLRVRRLRREAPVPLDEARLWRTYEAALGEVAALVKGAGGRLLVASWPSAEQAAAGASPPAAALAALCGRLGVAFVDLLPAMLAPGARGPLYLVPLDGHPSPEGHRAAAKALASRLLEDVLLDAAAAASAP
ncbi:MAG TPA: SGNH/GDSL hydrolase family protein [Candidatus Polarisedimenticolia bacterium]|nr:SGNH/GDSL hydrolase family protein [Candidatus Polarisedimenticolia bacterium]